MSVSEEVTVVNFKCCQSTKRNSRMFVSCCQNHQQLNKSIALWEKNCCEMET